MTDNTQELDEILGHWIKGYINGSASGFYVTNQTKQGILDWHNKQTEAVLDRLLEHGEDFTAFGDAGRSVAVEYIEAERNKLKESHNG